MFVQPFAASGRYYDFGELAASRSRDLRHYGQDGTTIAQQDDSRYLVTDTRFVDIEGTPSSFLIPFRDFNVRSALSNMVVRWEYRPGSTFFFVWQQNRSGFEPNGQLIGFGDVFGGYSSVANNFFALKANFWIPAL